MSQSQAAKYYYGLVNQGATCYLNSILQVLFMTDDFKERVKSHSRNNTGTERIDRELSDLFKVLEKYHGDTYNIIKKLNIKNVYEQRDAAEHYEKILRLTSPEASQIFHGELINRNKCLKCNTSTQSEAGFWHLPLPLVDSKDGYSVEKGIEDFFRSSLVIEDDQMYCERCNEKCDAVLDCEVKHHPEVLVLLLKRFEIDYKYMRKVKICCSVKMPDTLHMPQNLESYKLYAFVEHSGDLRFGHYIAKIKSQHNGSWYRFDDLNVTSDYEHFQLDPTEMSENVYLLFYQRQKGQHTKTSLTDIGRNNTPESSQGGVTNGTEDTHSSTEERERIESNTDNTAGVTNAHKKEHGTKDKPVRPASKRGTVSEENQLRVENHSHSRRTKQKEGSVEEKMNRNGESSQDEHMRFQENVSARNINNHSRLQNNHDYVSIEIPEDTHEEMRERDKSKRQDFDKGAHTKCKEPNVTIIIPGPHNAFSNLNVNNDVSRQPLSEAQAHRKNVNSKYCSQDDHLENFRREVEVTNEAHHPHRHKSGYDGRDRLGEERRTEINKSVQENNQDRIKRNAIYRSHDKSKGKDRSFMRNSYGDRGHNPRNEIDILSDRIKTLRLTEGTNGEQKRKEGKKRAWPEGSQDSNEGRRGQNNSVTQDSFNEEVRSSQEREIELETNANQAKKKKYKWGCFRQCYPRKKCTK